MIPLAELHNNQNRIVDHFFANVTTIHADLARVLDEQAADDLLGDVLYAALERAEGYDEAKYPPRNFLWAITCKVAMRYQAEQERELSKRLRTRLEMGRDELIFALWETIAALVYGEAPPLRLVA